MQDIRTYIENPEIFRVNRMDAHSDHCYYPSREDADANNQIWVESLNGIWKFRWSKNLNQRPIDFYQMDYDISEFDEIPVPSHIELNGYDKIHYTNTAYPWDGVCELRPPHIDEEYNPVGSYVKFFDLPEQFKGKKVSISFQGVEQGFSLYLNGVLIGYAEDSFTPSEFDITEHLVSTQNKLCVEVYKKTSAAWLEDQDFFRFSGIFRDVLLCARPKEHIEDLWIDASVNDSLTEGIFSFKVKMEQVPNLKIELYDQVGNLVIDQLPKFVQSEVESAYYQSQSYQLSSVKLWNVGKPYLYKLVITVMDENQQVVEVVVQQIGFRHFVIRDKVMYLNGERLIINGVNRHEWNPRKGRSITIEDMKADIEVFKRNNITAVRTSHYPNASAWYQLCDENGIIVMDETNLESHGSWQKLGVVEPSWNVPGSLPEWKENVLDRATSMFERDKNHPSILWWSCGNESFAGEDILAIANYFRKKDQSRYVHYESCFHIDEFRDCTDIFSRMYAYPQEIADLIEQGMDKPYILCEYMHNMGNSLGGMEEYRRLLDQYESFQGGFIWDYMDQAIYHIKNGKEVLGYGGDFTDRPSDYNFSGNGIVSADRIEKPAMQDVRFWYSSLSEQEQHEKENERIKETLKLETMKPKKGEIRAIKGDVNIGVKGNDFHMMFSKTEGGMVSLVYDEHEWLYRAPKPTYWRALTENDTANGFPATSGVWNLADLYAKQVEFELIEDVEGEISISYVYDTFVGTKTKVIYTIYADGTIRIGAKFNGKKGLPSLPLFGMKFLMNDKFDHYQYIGYSNETYPDRYQGGVFGKYTETVGNSVYLVPQEHGCHYHSYCLNLNQDKGNSLCFRMSETPFHFSVNHHTAQELEQATHPDELPDTGRSVVRILAQMRGVGGIDSWGADVEKKYHVSAEEDIELEFFIYQE